MCTKRPVREVLLDRQKVHLSAPTKAIHGWPWLQGNEGLSGRLGVLQVMTGDARGNAVAPVLGVRVNFVHDKSGRRWLARISGEAGERKLKIGLEAERINDSKQSLIALVEQKGGVVFVLSQSDMVRSFSEI